MYRFKYSTGLSPISAFYKIFPYSFTLYTIPLTFIIFNFIPTTPLNKKFPT